MIKDEPSLEKCRQLIESSLHWGDPAGWTNEDFEDLSERIFDKTDLRLSISTLKRIWGKVRYEHSPTAATLNALARFAGYTGWREFQQQHLPGEAVRDNNTLAESMVIPSSDSPQSPAVKTRVRGRRLLLPSLLVSAALLVGLISLLGLRRHSVTPPASVSLPENVVFENRKISDDLPNSVVFTYDVASLHPEKVIIQQSWDTTRREYVPANGKEHTAIYYYPGYFGARLIVDGTVRKYSPVFIKTQGWKAILERKPLPVYLAPAEVGIGADGSAPAEVGVGAGGSAPAGSDHRMGISAATLQAKTGSAIFNNTWVEFDNFREFDGIPGDHFTMTTTLRNTSTVEQSLCRKVKITVLGTESAIIIPLSDKGCISDLGLLTGERMINGKEHDLSGFGCDFSRIQRLSCTVASHRLKILLNQQQIFDTEQHQSIGSIVGIRISFEGAGEIYDFAFQGPAKQIDLMKGH